MMELNLQSGTQFGTTTVNERVPVHRGNTYWSLSCACGKKFQKTEKWIRRHFAQGKEIDCNRCSNVVRPSGRKWVLINARVPAYGLRVRVAPPRRRLRFDDVQGGGQGLPLVIPPGTLTALWAIQGGAIGNNDATENS